jgi:hypothetical protein
MNEQGDCASADVDDHLSSDRSNTITEFHGRYPATVHLKIVCAFSGDVIAQKLERISKILQREGALEISIAVSVNREDFRPTNAAPTSAGWMAPSKGADE